MVRVDARIAAANEVTRETVDIDVVIKAFQQANTRMNIIVLDACRDNPFLAKTGSNKGLAQQDAPPGTYLAFATAPGNVAEDGDTTSGNGLFTQFLIKELQRPARIEDVFKRVRLQVRQKSQGRQIPWDSSSLEDDFAFNDGKKHTLTPEQYQQEIQQAKEREDKLRKELELASERERQYQREREDEQRKLVDAQRIKEQQEREKAQTLAREREQQLALAIQEEQRKAQVAAQALEIARADEAQRLKDIALSNAQAEEEQRRKKLSAEAAIERQFAEEKAEWDKIKDSKNAQDFYAFLLKYPTGLISQQATFALESLDKAKITTQPDKNGLVQKPGEARFRLGDRWSYESINDYSGQVVGHANRTINRIEDGKVYAVSENGQVEAIFTTSGAHIQALGFAFDPPRMNLPGGEINVGQKWSSTSNHKEIGRDFISFRTDNFRVLAFEKISVKAGTFMTYKIQMQGFINSNRFDVLIWYLPDWGVPIKSVRRVYKQVGSPIMDSLELTSFTRGKE